MSELNYHHLRLFWAVAQEGSLTRGSQRLHLTPQTVSGQIRAFETELGEKLFSKAGRGLALTETGHAVFAYANDIFALGDELLGTLGGTATAAPALLRVAVAEMLPKLVVRTLVEPVLAAHPDLRVSYSEGPVADLLAQLAVHRLDVVLADQPIPPSVNIRAYNHLLGECGVVFMARRDLATRLRRRFPHSLDGAPVLLPSPGAVLRRDLDDWFLAHDLRPAIVGEFDDSALLKVFGQSGRGFFAVPAVASQAVAKQYQVRPFGVAEGVFERYYAISVERRIRHPAVATLCEVARADVFA